MGPWDGQLWKAEFGAVPPPSEKGTPDANELCVHVTLWEGSEPSDSVIPGLLIVHHYVRGTFCLHLVGPTSRAHGL